MARTEILAAVDAMTEAADCWQRAYRVWRQAVEHRDRVGARSERRVIRATGGLGLRQWGATCRRCRINTTAEACLVAQAVRARREVQVAVEEAEQLRAAEDAAVLDATLRLAETTKRVLRYGSIGQQLTGLTSVELQRVARRPPSTRVVTTG